jgi:hypothetical protein
MQLSVSFVFSYLHCAILRLHIPLLYSEAYENDNLTDKQDIKKHTHIYFTLQCLKIILKLNLQGHSMNMNIGKALLNNAKVILHFT